MADNEQGEAGEEEALPQGLDQLGMIEGPNGGQSGTIEIPKWNPRETADRNPRYCGSFSSGTNDHPVGIFFWPNGIHEKENVHLTLFLMKMKNVLVTSPGAALKIKVSLLFVRRDNERYKEITPEIITLKPGNDAGNSCEFAIIEKNQLLDESNPLHNYEMRVIWEIIEPRAVNNLIVKRLPDKCMEWLPAIQGQPTTIEIPGWKPGDNAQTEPRYISLFSSETDEHHVGIVIWPNGIGNSKNIRLKLYLRVLEVGDQGGQMNELTVQVSLSFVGQGGKHYYDIEPEYFALNAMEHKGRHCEFPIMSRENLSKLDRPHDYKMRIIIRTTRDVIDYKEISNRYEGDIKLLVPIKDNTWMIPDWNPKKIGKIKPSYYIEFNNEPDNCHMEIFLWPNGVEKLQDAIFTMLLTLKQYHKGRDLDMQVALAFVGRDKKHYTVKKIITWKPDENNGKHCQLTIVKEKLQPKSGPHHDYEMTIKCKIMNPPGGSN